MPTMHTALVVQNAFRGWMNEKNDWNFVTGSCNAGAVCGHWTQVVWAKTRLIGCGYAACPDHEYTHHVYCDYYPPGNYLEAAPFIAGSACTKCYEQTFWSATNPGYKCVDDLCVPCDPAEDTNCQCGPTSQCVHGTLNSRTCRCDCPSSWYGPRCEKQCVDAIPQYACEEFLDSGYCNPTSLYGDYARSNCPMTCELC